MRFIRYFSGILLTITCPSVCYSFEEGTVGAHLLLRAYTDCLLMKDAVLELASSLRAGEITEQQYLKLMEDRFELLNEATFKYFIDSGYSRDMAEQMTIWNMNILTNVAREDKGNCEVIKNLQ